MVDSTTLRVSAQVRDRVNRIGADLHKPANDVLELALNRLEEALFWEAYAQADARLKDDRALSTARAKEAALWDGATTDGLGPSGT